VTGRGAAEILNSGLAASPVVPYLLRIGKLSKKFLAIQSKSTILILPNFPFKANGFFIFFPYALFLLWYNILKKRLAMIKENIFRGRRFTEAEIKLIRDIAEKNRNETRTKISKMICELINWRQSNGRLKDRACRDVLLRMNERGLIDLPPIRSKPRRKPAKATHRLKVDFKVPDQKIKEIKDLSSLRLEMVRGRKDEPLWNW